jgi:hypothetical protein
MQPRGHALLIGMGGSGRKSLTQLAAFMCDLSVFQIELRKGYDAGCWRDDLKKLHVTAGQGGTSASAEAGTKCAFLLSDSQLTLPSMLDDINTLLNTGFYSASSSATAIIITTPTTTLKSHSTPLHSRLHPQPLQRRRNLRNMRIGRHRRPQRQKCRQFHPNIRFFRAALPSQPPHCALHVAHRLCIAKRSSAVSLPHQLLHDIMV